MSETVSTDRVGRGILSRLSGTRSVSATAIFIALAVALGFLLAPVPNVELVTLAVFVSGVVLGPARGALVGAVAMALYSGFSPNGSGAAIPPMYAAQIAAMAVSGLVGGLTARFWMSRAARAPWRAAAVGGTVGFVLTAFYQFLVIVGLAAASPEFNQGFLAVLVANAFFSTVHLVSNVIVFAIVAPALLARMGRAVPCLLVAAVALSLAAGPTRAQVAAPSPSVRQPGSVAAESERTAQGDSLGVSAAGSDTLAGPNRAMEVPEPGDDVRSVRSGGVAERLAREPGVRLSGVGWHGQGASVARGALPATLTTIELRGRPLRSWPGRGLGVSVLAGPVGEASASASGPDLSLWPVDEPSPEDGLLDPRRPVVSYFPWLAPPVRPYGRFTMRSGDPGRRGVASMFGRRYADGRVGVSGFLEREEGRAPVPGGSYERDAGGGCATLVIPGGPTIEVDAQRTRLQRHVPAANGEGFAFRSNYVVSTIDASGASNGTRIGLFHDEGWVDLRERDGIRRSLRLTGDGVYSSFAPDAGPFDGVDVSVSSAAASGSALLEGERRLELDGRVRRTLEAWPGWDLAVSGGWSRSAGSGYATAYASLLGADVAGGVAFVSLSVDGRHATALEREGVVLGSSFLDPERAVSLAAGWSGDLEWATLMARGEVARILGPISSREPADGEPALRNAADETSGNLSLGVSTAGGTNPGASIVTDLNAVDPDAALIEREPVPLAHVGASVWFSHSLFAYDYVSARWELSATHEVGRARGPWDGLMDDTATTVSACFTAAAGSAKVYLMVDDILDAAPERFPGFPGAGRTLSAGFSWRFWD